MVTAFGPCAINLYWRIPFYKHPLSNSDIMVPVTPSTQKIFRNACYSWLSVRVVSMLSDQMSGPVFESQLVMR